MAISSFSDLKTSMQKWLKRPDLAAMFPDFVLLAEQHFDRTIKTRARRSHFAITPTTSYVSLPSDWGRVIKAKYGGKDFEFFPASTDERRIYCGYRILGDKLAMTVPQLGQKLDLWYYIAIEGLSDSNQSNWLLEDAPDIYLWGSLAEGADYIRDSESRGKYIARRDAAIAEFIDDDAEAKTPEDQPLDMRAC